MREVRALTAAWLGALALGCAGTRGEAPPSPDGGSRADARATGGTVGSGGTGASASGGIGGGAGRSLNGGAGGGAPPPPVGFLPDPPLFAPPLSRRSPP